MGEVPKVELDLSGWTDVTSYVRYENRISITRGQQNEGSSTLDTSTCSFTLNNTDGRFSPRNPTSPYYGILGRNTPVRVSVGASENYLDLPDARTGYASAPDSVATSITGDMDVRIEAYLHDWTVNNDLIGKANLTGNQVSWGFYVRQGGYLQFWWSSDGSTTKQAESTETVEFAGSGRQAVRVTMDVNNGASGNTVTFYTADSISGTWTKLGDAVVTSGTTSIFNSTASLQVGRIPGFTFQGADGKIYAAEVRSGIGGTVVANPDFTAQTAAASSFSDGHSNTWTITSPASISDRLYRFWGELAQLTPGRDISGKDATVQVQASGISRRLSQGNATLGSTLYREYTNPARTSIIAYWPMEDASESTQIAAATTGVSAMTITGSPTLASYSGWTATDPVPVMNTGTLRGVVPSYTATGEIAVRMFVFVPSGGVTTETSLLHLALTGGTISAMDIRVDTSGNLRTRVYDATGASILNDLTSFSMMSRGFTFLNLQLSQSGSSVAWKTLVTDFNNTQNIHSTIDQLATSGTLSSQTLGQPFAVTVGREAGLTGVIVGHLSVADDLDAYAATSAAIAAHNGETPVDRMSRLCTEEEIGFTLITNGLDDAVTTMGDQLDKNLPDLLTEAASSDGGILFEPRDRLGFACRTRLSMVSRPADLTLSCTEHELNEALAPVNDDQRTLNDITVKRVAGSSYRVEQTTGTLSVLDPPNGVGRYDAQPELSLEDDGQLASQASWRLNLGTVDEARYPSVKVHLYSGEFDATLRAAALAIDVGDRLVITDPSPDLPPEDIDQLVLGYSEVIDQFEHTIAYVCAPYAPWHVLTLDDDDFDRVDTSGSTLAASATSTATTLSVASSGVLWTRDATDLPFDVLVAGERVTVTAVSGASSPQTFTVTRSVNGVVKAQSSGAEVRLPTANVISL